MATEDSLRAHVLRRLAFGPSPGQLEALAGVPPTELIEQLLAAPLSFPAEPELGSDDDYSRLPQWWLDVMSSPDAGLHERMTWFWHTHLTSGLDKSSPALIYRQHTVLRQHALGNFRELLHAVTLDAAMLYWLDGAGSYADEPNENYSREVMELFALGHGSGYTEADIRAGARALAGWWVDGDNGDVVTFDPDAGNSTPVDFLGARVVSAEDVINAVCDHPACAPFVVGQIHAALAGEQPSDARRAELADLFASNDLEIRPVVENIARHPSFLELTHNRPRSAVEWFIALRKLFDLELDWWPLDALGQVPFNPPNVAGWPGTQRWMSVGVEMAKAQTSYDASWETSTLDDDDPVAEVLAKAGLFDVSESTWGVLNDAAAAVDSRRDVSSLLHALVAVSPEFSVA